MKQSIMRKSFLYTSVGVVVAVAILAILSLDPPKVAREKRADEQRVSQLMNIYSTIEQYYNINEELPESLNKLTLVPWFEESEFAIESIEYNIKEQSEEAGQLFELCTEFYHGNKVALGRELDSFSPYSYFSEHPAGYHCFQLSEGGLGKAVIR